MTKEITIVDMPFADMKLLAEAIAGSCMFGIKTKEQALVLMSISHAEGRHPALAARDYDIIQGRPAKKAEAMQRDFLSAGGKVEWHALDDTIADATFSHPNGGTVRIVWDMTRAAKAQLADKDMYKKFPRQMLRSRTVSEGVRTVWPMATSGMYVPEEAADIATFNGPTIDHGTTIEADPPPSTVAKDPLPPAPKQPPTERTREQWDAWLSKLNAAMLTLYHDHEIVDVSRKPSVADAHATGPNWVRAEIDHILAENYARVMRLHSADDAPPDDDGEVRIVGEEKMGAG